MGNLSVTVTAKSNVEVLEIYKELVQMRKQLDKLLEKTKFMMSIEVDSAKEKSI